MVSKIVKAPFTKEQVESLNAFQASGIFHPFTCANEHGGEKRLIATEAGWQCPSCDYKQDWAHSFMAEYDKFSSCPLCKGSTRLEEEPIQVKFRGIDYTVHQEFYKCIQCGEEFQTEKQLEDSLHQIPTWPHKTKE